MERLLTISDIHGRYWEFRALLNKAEYNPDRDLLIINGDCPDKGPYSVETVELALSLKKHCGAIYIKGNHEFLYEEYFFTRDEKARLAILQLSDNGKNSSLNFYEENKDIFERHANAFRSLPFYYIKDNYIFVHAGFQTDKPISKQNKRTYVFYKDFFNEPNPQGMTAVVGHIPIYAINQKIEDEFKENFRKEYFMKNPDGQLKDIIYPTDGYQKFDENVPLKIGNKIFTDLGAGRYAGKLGLLQLEPEYKLYSVVCDENIFPLQIS